MKSDLSNFWKMFKVSPPIPEYKFHPKRRWRFDFAWPQLMIAIEIEGGIWFPSGGRHNRPVGYQKDLEKYNHATKLGWRVFRFTPQQFKNGEAFEMLEDILL